MPFAPHYRVTALGRLGNTAERFSYGINLARVDTGSPLPDLGDLLTMAGAVPNTTVLDDIAEDVRAFHGRGASNIHSRAVLEEVKIARIGADGKYTGDPYIANVANTPGAVGNSVGSIHVLPQSALAVSLVTARRGPSGKGRFFIPMPVVEMGDDLRMTAAVRDGIEASCVTLLEDLGNQPGLDELDLRVVVASTKGFNTQVTAVRVGRVVDTIRSRRRALDEDYGAPSAVNQV